MKNETGINRRSFLRRLGVAAGGMAAPLILPSRLPGAVSPGNRLNIAVVGAGSRSMFLIQEVLRQGDNIVALCDVDAAQIATTQKQISSKVEGIGADAMRKVAVYDDYRKLLGAAKSYDAVLIATGSRWHAPMTVVFLNAGKHVYCEKPLANNAAEARELVALAQEGKVVTQTGTQGASAATFRRTMELIQAGMLGHVRELHLWSCWCPMYPPSHERPPGEDPVPEGFNWDFWLGPAPWRPFKSGVYHPGSLKSLNWLDLSNGMLAGMGSHTFMLPFRALNLCEPTRVEAEISEPIKETYISAGRFRYEFPQRGDLAPVTLWWTDGNKYPPEHVTESLRAMRGEVPKHGCLFLGDKGVLYADGWGTHCMMKLKDDPRWRGVLDHETAKTLPVTLPRVEDDNHMHEWLLACKGGAPTFTDLAVGAKCCQAFLPGIISLRLGRPIDWDATHMKVPGTPEADRFIQKHYRMKWMIAG